MKAYKGFTKDLWSKLGDHKKENCSFTLGETKKVESSQTARSGFHCCENPFDCTTYYDLNGENRFFEVEASGDIDEDEFGRIACTEITLIRELTPMEFAVAGMEYIINHPDRGWMSGKHNVKVAQDEATAAGSGYIAIARGEDPRVKGTVGSILGLIRECNEEIVAAKIIRVTEKNANVWLRLNEKREAVAE